METIRYRPVLYSRKHRDITEPIDLGFLDTVTCKRLYHAGRIDDTWDIEVHIPDEDTLIEKPSTLWTK